MSSAHLLYLRANAGQIKCESKLPRRCGRRMDLWPDTVRCVLTSYQDAKILSECRALGQGQTYYEIRGLCNTSLGSHATEQCTAIFNIDATVSALGWGWHWVPVWATFLCYSAGFGTGSSIAINGRGVFLCSLHSNCFY